MELGEYIYKDIEKNSYLIQLYTNLLKQYTTSIFNIEELKIEKREYEKEIIDLLRFADILSKSTNESKRQIHNNVAQNVVVLLNILYPEDYNILMVMTSVLENIKNYRGLKGESKFFNNSVGEFIVNEIEKELYKIKINGEEICFVRDQKEIFQEIEKQPFYSYSGPTSIGKTFVVKTFIKDKVYKDQKNNFVIVVPSKALISEIYNEFIDDLKEELEKKSYKVITTSKQINDKDKCNYIMVYTQERFLNYLLEKNLKLDYVFIDEAHKLFEKDFRSMYFYKIIDMLTQKSKIPNIIFSSPLIENPGKLLELLPETITKTNKTYRFSPVNQEKFIINYNDENVRIYNDLTKSFIELDYNKIDRYDLNKILDIVGKGKKNIVYCDNKTDAINLAIKYAEMREEIKNNKSIKEIQKFMKSEIHEDYYLIDLISKGVAYHIGYIPSNIRKLLEDQFKNGDIDTIFCTSTLLEGVNLPADNLFITIKDKTKLLKSEINFKNLMGRVGRIKYNPIGNVFIIPKSDRNIMKLLNECRNVIENDIPNKELSIKGILTKKRKVQIVNNIKENKPLLEKNSMNYEEYNSCNFIINNLLDDILNNREGNFLKEFNEDITREEMERIRQQYKEKKDLISRDIPITVDKISDIDFEILKNNLSYPDNLNYKDICNFLEVLYDKFNWKNSEPKTSLGNKNNLKRYPILLYRWMKGMNLRQIITYYIKWHEEEGIIYDATIHQKREYMGTIKEKNDIINNVLDDIDNVLLFKISNYFSKFSERYKLIKNVETIKNDWHEFIVYGTNDNVVILLQQCGFSREIALKIKKKDYYILDIENNKIQIKEKIFEDKDKTMVQESIQVKYNYTSLFKE